MREARSRGASPLRGRAVRRGPRPALPTPKPEAGRPPITSPGRHTPLPLAGATKTSARHLLPRSCAARDAGRKRSIAVISERIDRARSAMICGILRRKIDSPDSRERERHPSRARTARAPGASITARRRGAAEKRRRQTRRTGAGRAPRARPAEAVLAGTGRIGERSGRR